MKSRLLVVLLCCVAFTSSGLVMAATPTAVTVDCNAGQTITAALDAQTSATHLLINVSGTCNESVTINRDDVTLKGVVGSTKLTAPANSTAALIVSGSNRIIIDGLQISNSLIGVTCADSPQVVLKNLVVNANFFGISISGPSDCQIQNTTIAPLTSGQSGAGLAVTNHATSTVTTTTISGFGQGILLDRDGLANLGSLVDANPTVITGNVAGVNAFGNSSVYLQNALIEKNTDVGIHVYASAAMLVALGGTATIRDNGNSGGIMLNGGSTSALLPGSTLNMSGNGNNTAVLCLSPSNTAIDVSPTAKINVSGVASCR